MAPIKYDFYPSGVNAQRPGPIARAGAPLSHGKQRGGGPPIKSDFTPGGMNTPRPRPTARPRAPLSHEKQRGGYPAKLFDFQFALSYCRSYPCGL